MINFTSLRQAYEMKEIAKVVRIPSAQNPAEAMTKDNGSYALKELTNQNIVDISPKLWVDRRAIDDKSRGGKNNEENYLDQEDG